jgi:succinyl-diaminopimelate desuccinylase
MNPSVREKVKRLLCDLVAIPSYRQDEAAILAFLADRFGRQGIPCRVTEVDGKPLNLIAEIGGGPRRIILDSHVDTVPPGDPALWTSDPLVPVERDGKIYGRGSEDAKGCLASMIVAFEELAARPSLPCTVILMAVGAEERGGLGTKLEVANGMRADGAIIGESTGLVPQIAHKGVLRLEVEVIGKAAHASDPEAGINAIAAMGPIITALDGLATEVRKRSESYTGHASLVISTIAGGTALNVIPARCTISIDRRVLPTEKEADVHQEIVAAIEGALPAHSKARADIRTVRFVPPSATAPDAAIVQAAEHAASRILHKQVTAVGFTATCDMTYLVNGGGIPTVIVGPGSIAVAHQADEHIPVEELAAAVPLYVDIIDTWAQSA